jgi:hypothetical protein
MVVFAHRVSLTSGTELLIIHTCSYSGLRRLVTSVVDCNISLLKGGCYSSSELR